MTVVHDGEESRRAQAEAVERWADVRSAAPDSGGVHAAGPQSLRELHASPRSVRASEELRRAKAKQLALAGDLAGFATWRAWQATLARRRSRSRGEEPTRDAGEAPLRPYERVLLSPLQAPSAPQAPKGRARTPAGRRRTIAALAAFSGEASQARARRASVQGFTAIVPPPPGQPGRGGRAGGRVAPGGAPRTRRDPWS